MRLGPRRRTGSVVVGRSSYVALGDVTLFVREIGESKAGGPPLLVIHGGPDWDHSYLLSGLERVAHRS